MDGLILIDKKSGMTSHDVVARFRRVSKQKKAGHSGTLDPMATGLLIICAGRATRLQSYIMGEAKTYEGEIQFGWATETYDTEGEPLHSAAADPVDVSNVDFGSAVAPFVGEIEQMPPAYSAKKIDGKRAYALAREGIVPKLEPRRVTIYALEITKVERSVASFRVRSSAGTYIRSIAHDLGQSLGIPAHLKSLRRTSIGELTVDRAVSVDRLMESTGEELVSGPQFVPMHEIELRMSRLLIDSLQEQKIRQGQTVVVQVREMIMKKKDLVALTNLSGELVAIGETAHASGAGVVTVQPKVVL